MKPFIHSQGSATKYGGKPEDYLKIHDWFDSTKGHFPDLRHRAILHTSFGIFLCEQVFGHLLVNSDGKSVSVRDIGEDHVKEDFHGFIPTVQDFLVNMEFKSWMDNGKGRPSSCSILPLENSLMEGHSTPKTKIFDPTGSVFVDGTIPIDFHLLDISPVNKDYLLTLTGHPPFQSGLKIYNKVDADLLNSGGMIYYDGPKPDGWSLLPSGFKSTLNYIPISD